MTKFALAFLAIAVIFGADFDPRVPFEINNL
jgi:hypothetical protein